MSDHDPAASRLEVPTPWRISDNDLAIATAATRGVVIETPLLPVPGRSPRLWVKLEGHQVTGSFKVRGALTRLSALSDAERRAGVVAASAGNHGQGVGFAARRLGVSAHVLVPRGVPEVKRLAIEHYGVRVTVTDSESYSETDALARGVARESGACFVSPYDDPLVAAGNGYTLGREIFGQLPALAALIVPVGGGGLLAGLLAARDRHAPAAAVIGVQSCACPAMWISLQEGRAHESYVGAPGLAEGLEGGVAEATFQVARAGLARMELVSEAAIAGAMAYAHRELGERIEGSAAVALAFALAEVDALAGTGPVVALLTGSHVDAAVMRRVLGAVP